MRKCDDAFYRGKVDIPKNGNFRDIAIPTETAAALREWIASSVKPHPDAHLFSGEGGQPLWRDSLLEDHFRPALKPVGLDWVGFQELRTTHASLGKSAKADVKVMSDQRGRRLGVAIVVYTRSTMQEKNAAVSKLENRFFAR